jgi:hypothetical protein
MNKKIQEIANKAGFSPYSVPYEQQCVIIEKIAMSIITLCSSKIKEHAISFPKDLWEAGYDVAIHDAIREIDNILKDSN